MITIKDAMDKRPTLALALLSAVGHWFRQWISGPSRSKGNAGCIGLKMIGLKMSSLFLFNGGM
jgi:hypothetical protein